MIETDRFEQVVVDSAAALEAWLAAHHGREAGVWLVTYRAHLAERYLSTDAVLDHLVAWGWIDGIRRKLDADRTMQLITPRKTQAWAKSYKDRAARLIATGQMRPPGLAAIEAGKASGLWSFWDDVDALRVPEDLADAFAATPPAAERWEALAPSYRRNVLRWIKLAKTPATRAKRIAKAAEATAEARKLPQM